MRKKCRINACPLWTVFHISTKQIAKIPDVHAVQHRTGNPKYIAYTREVCILKFRGDRSNYCIEQFSFFL